VRALPDGLAARPLTDADIEPTVALVERCDRTYLDWAGDWTPPSPERERERWRQLLARPDGWGQGAFDEREWPAGVAAWRQAEEESGSPIPAVAHVVAVFTDPERWGQGIAAHLLELAEAAMRERDFRVARLWTPRDAPARGFYEATGWQLDGRAKWDEEFALHLVGYEKPL
jgi:GNAT superfamily N-acetyltransferase